MKWEEDKLENRAEFKNGLNYSKRDFGKGLKVINVSDFKNYSTINYHGLTEINPFGIKYEGYLLEENDILFVRSNGNKSLVGRSLFINGIEEEEVVYSGFCIRCRFNSEKLNPRFYSYLFRTNIIRNTLSNSASGTNITNLNQTILGSLKIPIPPREVQNRIVTILSAYDDAIENNLRRIALLEEAAQNLYREWFVHFRFPGLKEVEFVDGLPVGWERKELNELILISKGKKAKEEFDRPNEETVNYLLVDVLERKNKRFCYPEKLRIAEEGETLMLMDGSRSGKVFRSIDGAIGSTLAVLRLKDERLSREFLYQYLKYREKEIISKNTGSAIPHANKSYIFSMQIDVPTDDILNQFRFVSEKIKEQVATLYEHNQTLKEARDILLPRLMNGTIEVEEESKN